MLLIDHLQSRTSPILKHGMWHYQDIELLAALDTLLQGLGYAVWSERYEGETERCAEMARQLVDVLIGLGVAAVQFGRLELTEDFNHALQTDYAYLTNQTRYVRQRLRQAAQNLAVLTG